MGQVNAIQMSTHNICLFKEVDKKYTGCNLKTTELLDCALVGVCAVIRLNMVVTAVFDAEFLLDWLQSSVTKYFSQNPV